MLLKGNKWIFLAFLAAVLTLFILPSLPCFGDSPSTVFVDDNYSEGSAGGHYFGYDAFNKIQDGINAVGDGGTVYVNPGTYTEQITIHKSLNLIGSGKDTTIVQAPTSGRQTAPGYTSQYYSGDNWQTDYLLYAAPTDPVNGSPISVLVQGFTFDANGQVHIGDRFTGIYFRKVYNASISQAGLFNCEVKGFSSSDPSVTGIRVLENSQLTLSGNIVRDYTIMGIVVYGTDNLVDPVVTTIGNTLYQNAAGTYDTVDHIQYRFINGSSDYAGTISGNTVNAGPKTIGAIEAVYSDHILISGNTVSGNQAYNGIFIEGSSSCKIENNNISNFSSNGIYIGYGTDSNNTILKNTISDIHSGDTSTLGNCGWGIGLDGSTGTISNTQIGDGTAANANVIYNCDAGVAFYGVDNTNTAQGNKIYNNSPYNLGNSNNSVTINAECNWWGSAYLPTIQSKISGNVDFDPYYVDQGMTTLNTTPPNTVYVDDNYSEGSAGGHYFGYDAFNKIQDGINAVGDGGTVYVNPGTYTEQITINKSLTLQGTGTPTPTITAPSTLKVYKFPEETHYFEPIVVAFGGSATGTDTINVSGSETINFNIEGLVIDGNGRPPSSGNYAVGLLLRNVRGNSPSQISQNLIQNMYIGNENTYGIFGLGDSDLAITQNTVTGYSKGGIAVNGDSTSSPLQFPAPNALIQENFVTGPGTSSPLAPNGIQIGKGATGKILNNTVTNNGYGTYGWTACGIIVSGSSNVEIGHNNVTQNKTGICVYSYRYSASDLHANNTSIHHNTVSQNKYGIQVQNKCNQTSIEYNTIEFSIWEGIALEWYGSEANVPTNTVIRYNTISNNNTAADDDGGGIWIDSGVNSVTITSNNFINNQKFGILTHSSGISYSAQYNWWGDIYGPNHSDRVSGNVDYDPWLAQQVDPQSPPQIPSSEIQITTTSCPTGALGLEYSWNLSCTGNTGDVTWHVSNTSTLPRGLTLSTAGVLSGVPAEKGTFNVEFTVQDSVQATSKTLTITILQFALEITQVRILDMTGTPTDHFSPGGFYQVEVTVKNNTDFTVSSGMVLMQSEYNHTPVNIGTIGFKDLPVGETRLLGTVGFNLPSSGYTGTWNVTVFGWSKWASQGGTPWALLKPASFTVGP